MNILVSLYYICLMKIPAKPRSFYAIAIKFWLILTNSSRIECKTDMNSTILLMLAFA